MNKYFKFVIAALLIGLGIFLLMHKNIALGIIVIILSIVPIFLFFRNEYVLLAFWQIRKQNLMGSKKWLDKITKPETQLHKAQWGYFHYLNGLVDGQENPLKAEQSMKKALQYGLTFDHDKALASLNLAAAALSKGRKKEAEDLLASAKKWDKADMLGDQIKMMKDQMKKMAIGRNMHNPNMRHRGKF